MGRELALLAIGVVVAVNRPYADIFVDAGQFALDTPRMRSPHEYVGLWTCRRNQSQEKKPWRQQRRPATLLSRHSHATVRCKRCASPKMPGIPAILQE